MEKPKPWALNPDFWEVIGEWLIPIKKKTFYAHGFSHIYPDKIPMNIKSDVYGLPRWQCGKITNNFKCECGKELPVIIKLRLLLLD